jgi:hypothetical protein
MTPEEVIQFSKQLNEQAESTIDLPMNEFCKYMEGKNVGEVRIIRGLLEAKLFAVDAIATNLLNIGDITQFTTQDRLKLANVFALLAKIEHKMSYCDYLYLKNSIE